MLKHERPRPAGGRDDACCAPGGPTLGLAVYPVNAASAADHLMNHRRIAKAYGRLLAAAGAVGLLAATSGCSSGGSAAGVGDTSGKGGTSGTGTTSGTGGRAPG